MPSLVEHCGAMARNNLWSNHRLHKACAQLTTQDYYRDRGAVFRSIHGTLNHILLVERFYVAMAAGEHAESDRLDRELYSDLRSLSAAQAVADRQLVALCEALTPERLDVVARWSRSDGDACRDPIHVLLAHLFVHQIHHRGQVHDMLSSTPVKPPQLDEYFLTHDAPLREAELAEVGIEEFEVA